MSIEQQELKTKLDELGSAWKNFRDTNDEAIARKAKEIGTGLVEEAKAKLNETIAQLTKEKNELAIAINRIARTKQDGTEKPEDYDTAVKQYGQFLRGKSSEGNRGGEQEFFYDKKSLSVISDSDGGYTVTSDMNGRIVKRIYETSPIRDLVSVTTISTDALEGLVDQDQVGTGWVAETGVRPQTTTAKWGKWRIPVHEMYAMPAATQKMLDDSGVDIEAWLADKVGDKMSRTENTSFVLGSGVGQPRGFLTYPTYTTDANTPQGSIEQYVSAASGTVTFDDLIAIQYKLKSYFRNSGQWGMTRSSIGYMRSLKDLQGRYLWEPGLQVGAPDRLLGAPVNELNDMPEIANSALAVIWADFKEFYQIVDRSGIRVLRDPYTAKPYILYYTTKRVGGDVLNFEAGKILKVKP